MTPGTPIYGKEGEELERKISHLIGRHNVLCRIEEAFANNKVATDYFEWARDEVIDSGNQSLASMFVIAIEKMTEYIEDHKDEDNTDVSKLYSRIYNLESKNRKLNLCNYLLVS